MKSVNHRILWPFDFKIKSRLTKPVAFRPNLESMENRIVPALGFQLKFDLTDPFFSTEVRALANDAASDLAAKFSDKLSALPLKFYQIPAPTNPSVLTTVYTSVDEDTMLVYVARASLGGESEAYSYSDFNSSDTKFRGQKRTNDFAPNISVISLDNNESTNWDLNSEAGKTHFKAIFTHELIHTMGILKKQPTWSSKIKDGHFVGTEVAKLFSPPDLAVEPGLNPVHFASGSPSLMTPQGAGVDITDVTAVDMAVLSDLGWEPITKQPSRVRAQPILFAGEKADRDLPAEIDLSKIGGRGLYRIEALNGYQFEFSTRAPESSPGSKVDTYLRFFDSLGHELACNDDDAVSASFSKLTYDIEDGGTYYLGVSLFSNKNYFIDQEENGSNAATGTFALHVKATNTFDIGDIFALAKDLPLNAFNNGAFKTKQSLSNWSDVDVYKVRLTPYEAISIVTSFTGTPGERKVDSYLRLFDSNGREILRSDDGGGDNYARLSFTSKLGGDYFIGVSNTLNRDYLPNVLKNGPGRFGGDYLLTLNRQMALPILRPDPNSPVGTHYLDVSYRSSDGTWFVIENNQGHGSLKPQKWGRWDQSTIWLDVNTADFNGDGLIDRIGRTPTGQWWMAKNLGSSFENVYLGSWNESAKYQDVIVGNFYDEPQGGAKIMDIAARDTKGTWYVFPLDSGVISEGTKKEFATVATGAAWKNITALDYNLDGYLDIIGRDINGSWKLLKNEGLKFSIITVGHWNRNVNWRDVKFADFSGDGLVDITGRESNGQWWISTNLQNDEFISSRAWKWNEAAGWRDVMLGDFVGDSRLDIIGRAANGEWWVAPTADVNLSILPVSSKANLSPFASRLLGRWGKPGQWSSTVLVGNFIGGGKADLVGLTKEGEWWISQNTGTALVSSPFFATNRVIVPTPVYSADAEYFVSGTLESAGPFSQGGLPAMVHSLRNDFNRMIDQTFSDWNRFSGPIELGAPRKELDNVRLISSLKASKNFKVSTGSQENDSSDEIACLVKYEF